VVVDVTADGSMMGEEKAAKEGHRKEQREYHGRCHWQYHYGMEEASER